MSDQFVQVTPDSTGKKVDVSELAVGANTVERQRVVIADPNNATGLAGVDPTSGNALYISPATNAIQNPLITSSPSAGNVDLQEFMVLQEMAGTLFPFYMDGNKYGYELR